MSFLTAEWRKLALVNYEVPPELLTDLVPHGTELDLWEGKCMISLVGFLFTNTKLLGISVPFHTTFEEVNLRFYVKRFDGKEWKRGVSFIKEIVPKPALSLMANTIYKEHYVTHPMRHQWKTEADKLHVSYEWRTKGQWQSLQVEAQNRLRCIEEGSEEEFITEHYWGYSKVNETKTNEYEVKHPRWEQYPVLNCEVNLDFGKAYGPQFAFLDQLIPSSVILAEGSEISVEKKMTL